jgi:energy-coupling factor transporter ATP-binding protein EcfA2
VRAAGAPWHTCTVADGLAELQLVNFKAFDRFRVRLGEDTFLVGPNNAGKSTLISAVRAAAHMLRLASNKPPDRTAAENSMLLAYSFSDDRVGLVGENLRHEFHEVQTRLLLRFSSKAQITAVWPDVGEDAEADLSPHFYVEVPDHRQPRRPKEVREAFPQVGVVPMLSPLELSETSLTSSYVRQMVETRLASRHFRNQLARLLYDSEPDQNGASQFDAFCEFAAPWMPELEVVELRHQPVPGEGFALDLFYREPGRRALKEIAWAGDGMQVWLQILYHLFRLRGADVIILDEPDLYLHADLQRRLVRLLDDTDAQILTATHSPEMLAEADQRAVVWVDKSRRQSVRAPKADALHSLATALGSQFNVRLAKALRARTVVFVEGKDMKIISVLAKTAGALRFASEAGLAVLQLDGFSNWAHVESFKWLLNDFLSQSVKTFVVLDRDYRPPGAVEEVTLRLSDVGVEGHVWSRKELESYLLVPTAISRASGAPYQDVEAILTQSVAGMEAMVFARALDGELQYSRSARQHQVTVTQRFAEDFRKRWSQHDERIRIAPPKEIVHMLNQRLSASGHRPVTAHSLARSLRRAEIDSEMLEVFNRIEMSLA